MPRGIKGSGPASGNKRRGAGRRQRAASSEAAREPTQEASRPLANVQARRDAIAESCEELYQLDAEIKVLTERHLKDLRDSKSDIMKRMREDYQINSKLLRARYQSYRIERMALDAMDDATVDVIRELFEALPIGELITITGAAPRAQPAARTIPDDARTAEMQREDARVVAALPNGNGSAEDFSDEAHDHEAAEEAGEVAGRAGDSLASNPYTGPTQKTMRARWESGWVKGQNARGAAAHEGQPAAD